MRSGYRRRDDAGLSILCWLLWRRRFDVRKRVYRGPDAARTKRSGNVYLVNGASAGSSHWACLRWLLGRGSELEVDLLGRQYCGKHAKEGVKSSSQPFEI